MSFPLTSGRGGQSISSQGHSTSGQSSKYRYVHYYAEHNMYIITSEI